MFIYGFLLTLVFNEAKLSISGAYAKGIVEAGAQRDYNILFMPVFFMSLCILVVRPLITQMAELWQRKKFQVLQNVFKNPASYSLNRHSYYFFNLFNRCQRIKFDIWIGFIEV